MIATSLRSSVDPTTAPRVGRLLGARKIVTGSIVGIGGDNFRLDGALINTFDSTSRFAEPAEGDVRKLFEVEKKTNGPDVFLAVDLTKPKGNCQ